MKHIYTAILFFFFFNVCYAQQLPTLLSIEGTGGDGYDDVLPGVVPTTDGGFILCMGTSSHTGPILCDTSHSSSIFRKYNADGSVLEWQKCFDNAYMRLFPTGDGNFVVGGYRNYDFYISKIDPAGNTIWIKYYGGSNDERPRDMIMTADGGYIMFGESNSSDGDVGFHHGGPFNTDLWAIKLDSSGNKIWSAVIGGTDEESAKTVVAGADGGCYLMGTTVSTDSDCTDNHGGQDVLIARLDVSGHVLWHRCLGGSDLDGWYGGACQNGKGGILVANGSESIDGDVHTHLGGLDYWVIDIDSNRNIVWEKSYGGTDYEAAESICKSTDGSIWIAGYSDNIAGQVYASYGSGDAWIVHADSVGNFLNSKVLGESHEDEARMAYPLTNGMILAGGIYHGVDATSLEFPSVFYGGDYDLFLARLAPWTTEVMQMPMGNEQLLVYPNPAVDIINITTEKSGAYKITIKDITGRVAYEGYKANGRSTINVRNWIGGLYFVEIVNEQGYSAVQKIIVQ
ncbi:MAG: T9SS type A sorting domain-containing protein [Bacteroidetes bacterium]|nr:T9SS type A sorting domain-containing protein [Bacteroidota bacterium]